MNQIKIEYVKNLHPIFTKPKRIKIIVGGRGSTKSTGVADYVAANVSRGQLWCCARETQNSIEESVHRNLKEEIDRLGIPGFEDTKTELRHPASGGRTFYRGLSRNITSLKSTLSGVDGLWIEEGEDITGNTLRVLTASVRLNAADTARKISGEDVKMPEIIITMNRGGRTGAIAEKWLERAERELQRCGFYEDDHIMVVEMNYTDMPEAWFKESGLESERLDDKEKMSQAEYDHKWHGEYYDEVEGSIIKTEWFDACIDAHLQPHLVEVFKPHGAIKASYDPFDGGGDAAGLAVRHGSIITHVKSKTSGEIDECTDWAADWATKLGADWFTWDGDGMGTGLKSQVATAFKGTKTKYHIFKGSLSGGGQDNATQIYMPSTDDKNTKPKTYAKTFKNNRAQYYVELARKVFNTYLCVVKGKYIDPDEMISFSSEGVENMNALRSQLCRIPSKERNGLIQILSKAEMATQKIPSPNEGDAVMMTEFSPEEVGEFKGIDFSGWNG